MITEKLKNMSEFTELEKVIAEFILNNPETIFNYSSKQLAESLYISSPTIIRFCKKLGYQGYPDFQRNFMKEKYIKPQDDGNTLYQPITSDNVSSVLSDLYNFTILQTKSLINTQTINHLHHLLKKSSRIDFYASDTNFNKIQNICLTLNSLGIQSNAFNTYNALYSNNINPINCLSFVISRSGNSSNMLQTAYNLRKHNYFTIALTGLESKKLELICNESLFIYSNESKYKSVIQNLSLNYLLDLILLIIVGTFSIE